MSIRVVKQIDFKNEDIKNKNQIFPKVSEHLIQLPFIALLIGSSGQGKTTTCLNFIKKYIDENAFDRIALFSPTSVPDERTGISADPRFLQLPITDMYADYTDDDLIDLMERQKDEIKEYKEYLEDIKTWEKYCNNPTEELEDQCLEIYERTGNIPPHTELKRYPSGLIIMDDLTDTLQKTGRGCKLNGFICRIRHNLFSWIGNFQSLSQASSTIRKQCNLFFIFKSSSQKALEQIYNECCSGDMNFKTFLEMFDMLQNRHDFILINLKAKDPKRKYRINFDKYLEISK